MDDVLRDMLGHFVYVYLDGILVFSQTKAEHVHRLLQCLLGNWLFVKAEKYDFCQPSVSFLGYVVSTGGIQMDQQNVQAVVGWPRPESRRELQHFLGFANFYRRFIRNYGSVASPLTALTSSIRTFP